MEINEALKRFRRAKGLRKHEDVSQAIGITRQSYTFYESGRTIPSATVIKKMAQAFDVSADYLLGLSDEPRPKPAQQSNPVDNEVIEIIDRLQRGFFFAGNELEKIREKLTQQ